MFFFIQKQIIQCQGQIDKRTMVHKTLHRKLKFEQLELHNRVLRKSSSSIIDTRRVTHLTICVRRDGKLIKVAVILGSPRPL